MVEGENIQYYISESSIKESINYFIDFGDKKKKEFGIFLTLKKIGFSSNYFISFDKSSVLSDELKEFYLSILHELGGICDIKKETPGKRTCLFPFAFSTTIESGNYYNGGSSFKDLISRMRDTIDNTLVDKFLLKDREDDTFKFNSDYLDYFGKLLNEKVDISYLVLWIYRFTSIDIPGEFENENHKVINMLVQKFKDEYNLNDEELKSFFEFHPHDITLSSEPISGDSLRALFNFKTGMEPEIMTDSTLSDYSAKEIDTDEFQKHILNLQKNPTQSKVEDLLKSYNQLVFYGAPGTGKSYMAEQLIERFPENNSLIIQFHPSYSYEDFVGGISIKDGDLTPIPGIFLKFCQDASTNNEEEFLLILDEINRGNIANIFGETILALDRNYEVTLPVTYTTVSGDISKLKIPKNLYIVATMNSADRSIGHIDYAIRRRFGFVKFLPDSSILEDISIEDYPNISIYKFLNGINSKIVETLNESEFVIGHSYFVPKDGSQKLTLTDFKNIFDYSILPLLEEYTFNNPVAINRIVGSSLANRLNDKVKFAEYIEKQFM